MENFENNLDYLEESVAALRMQNRVLAAALKGFLRALPRDLAQDVAESVQAALDLPTTLSTRKKREKTAKPIAQISEVNEPETPISLHENSDNVLLNAMGFSPIHPDLLAENLNLPAVDVYAELTELELDGWIVSMAGGRFQRVK